MVEVTGHDEGGDYIGLRGKMLGEVLYEPMPEHHLSALDARWLQDELNRLGIPDKSIDAAIDCQTKREVGDLKVGGKDYKVYRYNMTPALANAKSMDAMNICRVISQIGETRREKPWMLTRQSPIERIFGDDKPFLRTLDRMALRLKEQKTCFKILSFACLG